jgi:hypothetical protein
MQAGLAMFLLVGVQAALGQTSERHPCEEVVTCDCDNIEAGILNSGWKADCRQCETKIIEACKKAYPPISSAMAAGGYCEKSCSVTGPNPYPKAPAEASAVEESVIAKIGTMRLQCPLSMKLATKMIDGKSAQGCVGKDGKLEGVWFIVDEAAGTVTEIIFVNGEEKARMTRPLS